MDINNKVAVITGGTGGIGVEIVKLLLKNGIKFVALFDLDNANSRRVFTRLKKDYDDRVEFFSCDVTSKEQFSENFEKIFIIHNTIDILINNAGIAGDSRTELMIDTNYKAPVLASLLFIERVGKHNGGNGGVIVNTASILGLVNAQIMPIYSSTKHAIVSFTRSLNEQYNDTGVRVVTICPGSTDTPIAFDAVKLLDFTTGNYRERILNRQAQSPEIVADAVIKIIQKGKSGDVWVSEHGQPPYAVKDVEDYTNLRINIEE